MSMILLPAVAWYMYRPGPFIYFNLIGASFVLMIVVFKIECRVLGFNPFDVGGIRLSPEVRQITVRVIAWFRRHQNAPPLGMLLFFLLFCGVVLSLGPALNAITNPLLGFLLSATALASAMFLMATLQIVHRSATHPPNSSVTELTNLIERVGPGTELTPDIITHLSRRTVDTSRRPNQKVALGMGLIVLALMEIAGSEIFGLDASLEVSGLAILVMLSYLVASFISSYLSERRSALQELLEPN
jgi:hypothetical protein